MTSGLQFIGVHRHAFLQMAIPNLSQGQSNLFQSLISLSMLEYSHQIGLLAEWSLKVTSLTSRIILLPYHLMYHPITHRYIGNDLRINLVLLSPFQRRS